VTELNSQKEPTMPIEFEGLPPYEPLFAVSAESAPSLDGVAFTVTIAVDGLPIDCVPFTVLLEPQVARDLAAQLKVNADVDGAIHHPFETQKRP
jgi:hypothetical protein